MSQSLYDTDTSSKEDHQNYQTSYHLVIQHRKFVWGNIIEPVRKSINQKNKPISRLMINSKNMKHLFLNYSSYWQRVGILHKMKIFDA